MIQITPDHFLWDAHVVDTECYKHFWLLRGKRLRDGVRFGFELSERSPTFDREKLRRIMRKHLIITFNGMSYDMPMIWLAIQGATNEQLKSASDRIIKGNIKYWEVERALEVHIPKLNHIDIIEPQPAVMTSLKTLNGRLHGPTLQDFPFGEAAVLTLPQMDEVSDYCDNDVDATTLVTYGLEEALKLRIALGEQYGMDFRSKSDAQMGEGIIKKRVEEITGNKPQRVDTKPGTSFKYAVPDFFKFQTKQLQDVVAMLRDTEFVIKDDGKVDMPKALSALKIPIGESVYTMGIGGLHSTEANRAVHSDDTHVLIDADVASQYPSIIMKLGLYPKALGKDFLTVYGGLIKDRLEAKKTGDKVRDKAGKIALNGAYGKLGSRYSVLYAPHLLISVTLTGQLSLLMLIEMAELAGIPVVSGNTDGVIFRCPRQMAGAIEKDRLQDGKLKEIIEAWEQATGFKMEVNEYRSIYNLSVNSYMAIKSDGKVKRKGPIGNPWSDRKEENDTRAQMQKNPQMTICSDAVLQFLLDGTPIEKTIREATDVRGFVTVVAAAGGATWRDEYLGKVVRYIWSTDGEPIIKVKAHPSTGNRPKVPKTDGCRPLMELPEDFAVPDDTDFARYIAEAKTILADIGYVERQAPAEAFYKRLLQIN